MGLPTSSTISSIGLAGALLVAGPLATDAQDAAKVYRIGVLEGVAAANAEYLGAFRQGLRDLGYVEEWNLVIDYRSAEGGTERFPDLATELVRLKVDVIVTRGSPAALAAKQTTRTIPIVMASSGDPAAEGIVTRLTRPEGNVTDFHSLAPPGWAPSACSFSRRPCQGHREWASSGTLPASSPR